tara:strand:+ start:124 stop:474 length:351 start_codon:yes stop_codon:yes gene_type:complete
VIQKNFLAWIYLAFAFAGAIFPTLSNIEFIQMYGSTFDIQKFIELANSNPASESLSRDLFIGAGSIFVWIINESRRLKMKNLWVVLLGTFLIAFAFAAPLFLFLRERRLIEMDASN